VKTYQTNVRVEFADRPLIRMIAARLRAEPGFRDRLKSLLDEDVHSDLLERIERLEQRLDALAGGAGEFGRARPELTKTVPTRRVVLPRPMD
jgi:hypothetical protein